MWWGIIICNQGLIAPISIANQGPINGITNKIKVSPISKLAAGKLGKGIGISSIDNASARPNAIDEMVILNIICFSLSIFFSIILIDNNF
jgi:hypothetical protein